MVGNLHIQRDWVTVLAFLLGAAVVIPSMLALALTLSAIGRLLV